MGIRQLFQTIHRQDEFNFKESSERGDRSGTVCVSLMHQKEKKMDSERQRKERGRKEGREGEVEKRWGERSERERKMEGKKAEREAEKRKEDSSQVTTSLASKCSRFCMGRLALFLPYPSPL
ncbi:UNVERIFIED_CONTAM: hypothetical protein K2H54_045259 [Gekko kuhli]